MTNQIDQETAIRYITFVLITLKGKLYPSKGQARELIRFLDNAREVYNDCLNHRRQAWKEQQKSVSRFDQQILLTTARARHSDFASVPVQIQRDAVRRVDLGFQAFFRRCREGGKPGYPRFKSEGRYNSFRISNCGNILRIPGRIRVSGVGLIRCRGLCESKGEIKQLTIVRRARSWRVRVLIETGRAKPALIQITTKIGIDLGLTNFVATSEGEKIPAPKSYRKLERDLRQASKHLSHCQKGSSGRQRAKTRLALIHERIADTRDNFTHQLSRQLVNDYSLIAAEKLNIVPMVKGRFAKSIMDASWGSFLWKLSYKAANAGKRFVQVEARGTTQECSGCGITVSKGLHERVHRCPNCKLELDRDVNAARNVLARALHQISAPPSGSDDVTRAEGYKTVGQPVAGPLKLVGSI